MTYSYSSTPLYVREGDYVQFKFKAPPLWDFTQTVTVQIGDLTQFWYITTVPEDFTPDPFPFQKIDPAELDTLYTYGDGSRPGESIITVTGLTPTTQAPVALSCNISGDTTVYAARFDYDGDGTWDTGWIQPRSADAIVVENGAKIQVRARTENFTNSETRLTLIIGTSNETWSITTESIPLNIPEPFPNFDDLNGLPTNTMIYSNILRVQGLNDPANVSLSNGAEFGISSTNTTSTNGDGYDVLSGITFNSTATPIENGEYLQLRMVSPSTAQTPKSTSLTIGDRADGSAWTITTGNSPSTTPNSFTFQDITGAIEDFLVASDPRPVGGLTGLGVPVEVTLVDTTSTEVKIKINNGSVVPLPVTVENGDEITLYARSSPNYSETVETRIKVGNRTITAWQVGTNSGPDYDAVFNVPQDRNNVVPNTYITSSVITITEINQPITITATNGALISIDYDIATAGPRTFDPRQNSTIQIILLSSPELLTPESTEVVVGTEAEDLEAVTFTWTVRTYATAPPPLAYLGVWYSKKTEKFDGYPIGTVLPILKENVVVGYGDLSGDIGSRYPGFVPCDGSEYDASRFPALWDVIGNTYGGNASYDDQTKTYSGTFKVPDYRNRKLAGTGFVDGNKPSSAFLPVDTIGKGIFDVGAEGGYWYFDKVDVSGGQPLEQVIGTGNSGIDSQFFSLGTIRLFGLETLVENVTFTITGEVFAQVGPLGEVLVNIPEHDHSYLAAVVESDGGDPLNPWEPEGRALFRVSTTEAALELGTSSPGEDGNLGGSDDYTNDLATDGWISLLNSAQLGSNFTDELRKYNPNYTVNFFANLLPVGAPPFPGSNFQSELELDFLTYWGSPDSVLSPAVSAGLLRRINPADDPASWNPDHRQRAAVIDTDPAVFQVRDYTPPTGQTNSHSHYITVDPVEDAQTDYSGGNTPGAGILGAPYGSGLGGGATSIQLLFTQDGAENAVFMDMTDAEFTFQGNFKRPTPDVALAPQRQVPILNPFHKTKYVIKAY